MASYMSVTTLLCLVGAVCHATEGLELRLVASKPVTTVGQPVDVRVSIENADSTYWVVYPYISPGRLGVDAVPRNELAFEIVDERGKVVRRIGNDSTVGRLKEASLQDFLVLGPRFHYGLTVSLNSGAWAHDLHQPGRYRVRAHLFALSRTWVSERLKAGRLKRTELRASVERFIDETLQSNEIGISIQP